MEARFSYLSHLECSMCHRQYDSNQLHTTSPCCSRPLLAQYDLASIARDVTQDEIARREASMWRYHELLPVREKGNILTLGEGMTPLLAASRFAPFKME
jgi:threonine synthase